MACLRKADLRPTRQRVVLCELLFGRGDRHVTAEMLHDEANAMGMRLSLATVYNTLHQLQGAGLVRQIIVDGGRSYFDTNTHDHAHFFEAGSGALFDARAHGPALRELFTPPSGMEVESVDVIVRLKPAATSSGDPRD